MFDYQMYLDSIAWSRNTILIIESVTILSAIYLFSTKSKLSSSNTSFFALSYAALLIFRFGCAPIEFGFGSDRDNYANSFLSVLYNGIDYSFGSKDPLWMVLSKLIAFVVGDVYIYFIIITCLYIGLYFLACQKLTGGAYGWLMVGIVACMGFPGYGTNTMRAGLAIALIVCGIAFSKKRVIMYSFFIMAILTHMSMIIPISSICLARYYDKTTKYLLFWIMCVFVSLAAGNTFNEIFSTFIDDPRSNYLLLQNQAYRQGFRWDFIIYSFVPMLVGLYYTSKKNFKDSIYLTLLNAYILTNSVWVLVIRANFTDRFAYLSWFMMPFILIYPLLSKHPPVKNPNIWVGTILLGETAFMIII